MARLVSSLVAVLLVASASAIHSHRGIPALAPSSCSWSPLLLDKLSCSRFGTSTAIVEIETSEPTSLHGNSTAQRRSREEPSANTAADNELWTGPHYCVSIYCVYANPTFDSGRGIVLITTARVAQAIANLPVFLPSTNLSAFRPPNQTNFQTSSPLYRVAPVPGKGLGLIATQLIRRGQQIMAYTPAVLANLDLIMLESDEQNRLLDEAVAQLPEKTREAYMAQVGFKGGHWVADIMHTNSFGLDLDVADELEDDKPKHFGAFPEVSRFNHDCRPNTVYYMSPLLQHVTHAVRDIAAGEELTLSYLDAFKVRAVRQERALKSWGFRCTCAHCSLSQALTNASDLRLADMHDLQARLTNWGVDATVEADDIEYLLGLYELERMRDSHGSTALTLAALNYNALGREVKAKEYAARGLEQSLIQKGPWSGDVKVCLELMGEPKDHWTWKRKVPVAPEEGEGRGVVRWLRGWLG